MAMARGAKRPRIIIPTGYGVGRSDLPAEMYLKEAYVTFIQRAGGLPILAPAVEDADEGWYAGFGGEGLLLVGGDDMDPTRFGQKRHPKTKALHPRREASDFAWFAFAEAAGLPILGICLGAQVINVARGGSLHQFLGDLPGTGKHTIGKEEVGHGALVTGPLLRRIVGEKLIDLATHHKQAVDSVGRELVVAARAPDGVVEAVEDVSGKFILGVQWHPEEQLEHPATIALGRALIDAAAKLKVKPQEKA